MPALHGKELCYSHFQRQERMRRKPRAPQWSDNQVPLVLFNYMEDHASILSNLNAAADAFARHDIDYRQLSSITRFFQTCLCTLRQMHRIEKAITAADMVRDVVTTSEGELQALPDPAPTPLPDSPSTPEPDTPSPKPAPATGVVPAISACVEPEAASSTHPNPASRPEQDHVFQSFTRQIPVSPLSPTLSRTPIRNPFISDTYVLKSGQFSHPSHAGKAIA